MKLPFPPALLGLLALLSAQGSLAASATVTASDPAPLVGDTFTVTVQANATNTFAATMALAFDATKVAFVGGAMPASGPFAAANGGSFIKNSPTTQNPTVFDIVTNDPTTGGSYDAVVLTFQALAPGDAAIVIDDDGGSATGWFDADTADWIPVTYTQASVLVNAAGPNIVVTDDAGVTDDHALAFGSVALNLVATHTVTVTNAGTSNLTLGQVGGVQALTAPFTLVNDNCSGQVIAAAGNCSFQVEFQPTVAGNASGTLDIASDDGDTPSVTVTASGSGADPAADPAAASGGGSALDGATLLALGLLALAARQGRK